MILLVADIHEYKANPDKRAKGVVIEAKLDKGRGAVATVLVQNGTLKIGDCLVAGSYFGKVRAMLDDNGKRISKALPSAPVEILGLTDVPKAGDPFIVFEDERKAKEIAERRRLKQRDEEKSLSRVKLDDIYNKIKEGDIKELNIILKADVHGSCEALKNALEKISIEKIRVKIIHLGVGAITESDILLALASKAIIIGFNVRIDPNAKSIAEREKVDIRLYKVIYDAVNEITLAMKGLLDPEYKEAEIGTLEVRKIFKVSKIGTIAGCYVLAGKITRDSNVRLVRDGVLIYEGKLESLKRFKDDVKEVSVGYECGLTIQGYNDIKEGDIIEAYVVEEVKV